jgi:signal transduction histidine kinase
MDPSSFLATDPLRLSAALQNIDQTIAYAHVTHALTIAKTSDNLPALLDRESGTIIDQPLTDVCFEFIGSENQIHHLAEGQRQPVRFTRVNRMQANGDTAYIDLELSLLDVTDPLGGYLLLVRDTTELGQLEQSLVQERNELRLTQHQLATVNRALTRLDQLKSIFLSMAAHDIRTPLIVIRGYAELLNSILQDESTEANPDEIQQYLKTISVQTDWLDTIINNILGLDQIENDQLVLHKVACSLNEIVSSTTDVMAGTAHLSEQNLRVTLPEQHAIVNGDPQRLQQVLHNLIGNAVKYTPRGGTIEVTLVLDSAEAILTIADNGFGIRPEQQAHVFDLYYRTERAQHSQIKGTGLGLFIVKTLVEAHDGTIAVQSELGQGTQFTVRIPLSRVY